MGEVGRPIASASALRRNFALSLSRSVREAAIGGADRGRGITGFGEVSAAVLLAGLPNVAGVHPEGAGGSSWKSACVWLERAEAAIP